MNSTTTAPNTLPAKTRSARPWWTQLWVWVLIGMAAGIALGVADPDLAAKWVRSATPSSS
jgi:Na+/H+-dicarboxylate symporter